jgi:hypothetical protein
LRGRATGRVGTAPREGTKLRQLYDLFQANKGQAVFFNRSRQDCRRFNDLTDYYGLEIQQVRRGQWILAGEWFGNDFVDYTHLKTARAA